MGRTESPALRAWRLAAFEEGYFQKGQWKKLPPKNSPEWQGIVDKQTYYLAHKDELDRKLPAKPPSDKPRKKRKRRKNKNKNQQEEEQVKTEKPKRKKRTKKSKPEPTEPQEPDTKKDTPPVTKEETEVVADEAEPEPEN